jgi:hypothetical protein
MPAVPSANAIDWPALERLRAAFLAGTAGQADYWDSDATLAGYDATFAQRIGWKWDYVLAELQRRGWVPPGGPLVDWGCGSGIAHRAYLDWFGANAVSEARLWDRSARAVRFAAGRAAAKYPGLKVATGTGATGAEGLTGATVLLSHVLTELTPDQLAALEASLLGAAAIVWVEPGTYEVSLTLIALRERLRRQFHVVAPCLHGERCGILAPENERHWCHHFASPPPGVFTDPDWGKFSHLMNVDLRDLPVSFLVLDRRPAPPAPPGAVRVIGRPRLYKPHALLQGCDAAGVSEKRLTRRAHPETWRNIKRGDWDALQIWECDGEEIVRASPLPSPSA